VKDWFEPLEGWKYRKLHGKEGLNGIFFGKSRVFGPVVVKIEINLGNNQRKFNYNNWTGPETRDKYQVSKICMIFDSKKRYDNVMEESCVSVYDQGFHKLTSFYKGQHFDLWV